MDVDIDDRMSEDEENLESKPRNSSSFFSISFDVVVIMSFILVQDKNSEDEH